MSDSRETFPYSKACRRHSKGNLIEKEGGVFFEN
jgi:hypothetical protein